MTTPAFTHFTVDQANRALPLVRRIVADIVTGYADWRERVHEFEAASALSPADAPDPCAEALQREAQRLAADIDGCVRELAALGVEFKGFDLGLVDFPGEVDGQPVYLCWRLGEPAVQHWHARDMGYADRQPLAAAVADATADATATP